MSLLYVPVATFGIHEYLSFEIKLYFVNEAQLNLKLKRMDVKMFIRHPAIANFKKFHMERKMISR